MKSILKKIILNFFSIVILISFSILSCNAYEKILKIVITGGSCAGKTSSLPFIKEHFDNLGYDVHILNEIATKVFTENSIFNDLGTDNENPELRYQFQHAVAKNQVQEEEKLISKIFESDNTNKISLLICDRGLLDGKVFLKPEEFTKIVNSLGEDESQLSNRYDAVFHMTCISKYLVSCFVNTDVRRENHETSIDIDNKILEVYSGSPYRKIIDNFPTLEEKVEELIKKIEFFLNLSRSQCEKFCECA